MGAIDFGISLPPTPRRGTIAEWGATNDRLLQEMTRHGLTLWVTDHFQLDDQPILECFALLAHTVGRFPGLRSGTLVLGQSYRNPALTAKIASTLDHLTGGQFILGIGAGWKEDEYRAYGFAYPSAARRIAELDEAVRIIRALWGSGPVTFEGQFFQVRKAYNEPRSATPPILMIGGGGEQRTLRIVAEQADWWNADYYTLEDYTRKLAILRRYASDCGRDPEAIVPTYYGGLSISRDPERLIRTPPSSYRPNMFVFSGDPDDVTRQIERFAAAGVRHMQVNFLDFPGTETLDHFLADVLPRFQ